MMHSFDDHVSAELRHAFAKHGREPWGRHEFYGILREELDELWDAIKSDAPTEDVLRELFQVAAVCRRYYVTGDRYLGEHPEIGTRTAATPRKDSDGTQGS